MFGESDEKYRIKGGSSALIKALVDALQARIDMKQGWALTSLDYKDKKIVMGFDAPRWTADAKLRCGDPRFALHQASSGDRLGEAKAH